MNNSVEYKHIEFFSSMHAFLMVILPLVINGVTWQNIAQALEENVAQG